MKVDDESRSRALRSVADIVTPCTWSQPAWLGKQGTRGHIAW